VNGETLNIDRAEEIGVDAILARIDHLADTLLPGVRAEIDGNQREYEELVSREKTLLNERERLDRKLRAWLRGGESE
jgi:hypothetical protein